MCKIFAMNCFDMQNAGKISERNLQPGENTQVFGSFTYIAETPGSTQWFYKL